MARPLRIEFAGALYHVTARGNAKKDIYQDDVDREIFLELLGNCCERYGWLCHAYCLMSNHYHLLIETSKPTLSKGMKYINGTYTQSYNRLHQRTGHVYEGRFKAILVERDSYLLELARYIVLNPVRAQMVHAAQDWPWSSYRATVGLTEPGCWLKIDWVLSGFGRDRKSAGEYYRKFVCQDKDQPSPWASLKNQIYLGSDDFVALMQCKLDPDQSLQDIPKQQKQSPPKPLDYYQSNYADRCEAMAIAYQSGHYTLAEVGKQFGVSYATVSRAVKAFENDVKCKA
ncbi:MAG: putative transposase [Motiliproteus sp.]|jgi:putative transposase